MGQRRRVGEEGPGAHRTHRRPGPARPGRERRVRRVRARQRDHQDEMRGCVRDTLATLATAPAAHPYLVTAELAYHVQL
ncbi:hypothetical protein FRIGORI9N_330035 [Frigoribacterium sp. 9N]|nr:hypothetical protein FRIGORI9N_330035 [Frigoribacterium sp. 9N]